LFDGLIGLKIQKSTRSISRTSITGSWGSDMEILDIVVQKMKGMKVVNPSHLEKFFSSGSLSTTALLPLELKSYARTKGATAHLGSNRKRKRQCIIEANVMIPTQRCGIAPRKIKY
jgi:hypothetical protein